MDTAKCKDGAVVTHELLQALVDKMSAVPFAKLDKQLQFGMAKIWQFFDQDDDNKVNLDGKGLSMEAYLGPKVTRGEGTSLFCKAKKVITSMIFH